MRVMSPYAFVTGVGGERPRPGPRASGLRRALVPAARTEQRSSWRELERTGARVESPQSLGWSLRAGRPTQVSPSCMEAERAQHGAGAGGRAGGAPRSGRRRSCRCPRRRHRPRRSGASPRRRSWRRSPGADVGPGADLRVTEVAEVLRLGTGTKPRLLHLGEVADLGAIVEHGPHPQVAEGADLAVLADGHPAADDRARKDLGAAADGHPVIDEGRARVHDPHAVRHVLLQDPHLELPPDVGELGEVVHALRLALVLEDQRRHRAAVGGAIPTRSVM